MVNPSRFASDPRIDKPWGSTLREKLPRSVRLRYVNWRSKERQQTPVTGVLAAAPPCLTMASTLPCRSAPHNPKSKLHVPHPCSLAKERSQHSPGPPSAPNTGDPVPPSPLHCAPGPCSCPPERSDAFAATRSPSQAKIRSKTPPNGRLRPTPVSRRRGAPISVTPATPAPRPNLLGRAISIGRPRIGPTESTQKGYRSAPEISQKNPCAFLE